MPRIIAIDYGLKRVGLAVTDPLKIIAQPLKTIDNEELSSWLKDYLEQEEVEAVVVGMPRRLSGEDTHATEPVRELVSQLESKYPELLIETVDERLTSRMAKQSLIDSGVPKQKRKQKGALDSVSAALILQTYLDKIR